MSITRVQMEIPVCAHVVHALTNRRNDPTCWFCGYDMSYGKWQFVLLLEDMWRSHNLDKTAPEER